VYILLQVSPGGKERQFEAGIRCPRRKVVAFIALQPLDRLYLSTVTLADVGSGIELLCLTQASVRISPTGWRIKSDPCFEQRVLPVSEDILFKWRLLVEDGRKAAIHFRNPTFLSSRPLSIMVSLSSRPTPPSMRRRV
jgi:toxin FitB